MSADSGTTSGECGRNRERDHADPQAVLDALRDRDCRRVVSAVADDPLTARECSRDCDIPLSTVYRKLELLEAAGLVDRTDRTMDHGKQAGEFALRARSVDVRLDEDASVTVASYRDETAWEH